VYFRDAKTGWAVGALGTVLSTTDGGATWTLQRRGGQRCAVLMVHARPSRLPLDTAALLGGRDGFLTAAVCVTGADPNAASFDRAGAPERFRTANRTVGGAAGETLWQFPLPADMATAQRDELVAMWDRMHNGRGTEQ